MKAVRIVFNTGEADENGKPILKRSTLQVEESVTTVQAEQIANLIDSLSAYTLQEAYLITTTQVI